MNPKPAPAREILQKIAPYQPGKPISEVQRELGLKRVIKLASNENHLGPAPSALKAMREALEETHLYPDGSGYELKQALSEFFSFKPEEIILGNGSNEIVEQVCESFINNGDRAVTGWPAFIKYRIAIRIMGGEPVEIPLKDFTHDLGRMFDAIDDKTKVVFIADPNNPTGTILPKDELEDFIKLVPENVIIVLDQAYYEYIPEAMRIDVKKFIREGRNLIALRTFSKVYGLAGLRIGYGFARPEIISEMNKVREAFNTSSIAQIAATAALKDQDYVKQALEVNRKGIAIMYSGFDELGLDYVNSITNFVLVNWKRDGGEMFRELLKRGVIVRPMGAYDLPTFARVSTSTEEDMRYFIEKLREIL